MTTSVTKDSKQLGRPVRVLFVNPPSMPYNQLVRSLRGGTAPFKQVLAMPMGLLYLAAVLERELTHVEVRLVDVAKAVRDFTQDPDRHPTELVDFAEKIITEEVPEDFQPDFIGLSILFSTAARSAGAIAEGLKRRWPNAPVIIGGMHATNDVGGLLTMNAVDYVCRGEGESIIIPFAQAISEGRDPEGLPGIYGRAKLQAQSQPCELAPWVEDLDEIPFPAWHLLKLDQYIAGTGRARRLDSIGLDGEATIITTRGCPFSCTFCSSWTVHGRKMRYRSIENVVEEIRTLYHRFGVRVFVPEDDLFTVKKERVIGLCNAVADEFEGIAFQFPNGLSVATLDEDVIRALMRMGMTVATIAVESGAEYTQRHIIKKNCNLDRARKVVQACRDLGVISRTYFVMGFPGETRELMEETVAFAQSIATDWSVFFVAAPLIGSEMYHQFKDGGFIDASFNWDEAFYHERNFDTPEISAEELKSFTYRANLEGNFFRNYNLRIGNYERALKLFEEIAQSYPDHLAAHYCIGLAHKGLGHPEKFDEAVAHCARMLAESTPGSLARRIYEELPQYFPELTPPAGAAEPWVSVPPPPRATAPM